MQAVPKKPNFKCPKFSVPAKPQSEISNSGKKIETKKDLPEPVRSDGDSKVSSTEQDLEQASQSGNSKFENAEMKDTSIKAQDVKESGDSVVSKHPKDENIVDKKEEGKYDNVNAQHPSTFVTDKKAIEKKNKRKFTVKSSLDNQKDAGNKTTDKEKKKKENKSDVHKQKIDKEKKEAVEKKESKEKKDTKTKEPKITLPVKSLTDDEYTAIFDAAIENALNLNIDEWAPKATSPVKNKEPVKKKYSITVGKKVKEGAKSTKKSCPRPSERIVENNEEDEEHEVLMGLDNSEVGEDIQEEAHVEEVKEPKTEDIDSKEEDSDEDKEENNHDNREGCDDKVVNSHENGAIAEKISGDDETGENADEMKLVDDNNNELEGNGDGSDADEEEEIVVDEIEEEPVQERAQEENEMTPVGSEADIEERHSKCIVTPTKKKKIPKVKKNPKLEPKQLPFERPKEVTMVDQVKQLKKQKLEKQEFCTKKRKLVHEVKRHGVEKVGSKSAPSLAKDVKRKKPDEKKRSKKQKMQERELEINGTWVQCCNSTCMKWRYLSDVSDPSLVPERWTCSMNTNKQYDSCEKAEEEYDESEHIYTKFAEGSVVWARMTGYPWWPAMVEIDPDSETYFSIDTDDSMIPTHYHVVFFDDHVSRTWVKSDHVKMFTGIEEDDGILYQIPKKGQAYKKEVAIAKRNAMRARSCTIQERIELFGFAARFKGSWSLKSKVDKTDKGKGSKVTSGQTKSAEQVTYLDEDTMDDVMENTEALLDNVEEMLESVNSQLDDSDADSDFMPEELIVVERKKKTVRKSSMSNPSKIKDSSKKKVNFSEGNTKDGLGNTNNITDKELENAEENSEMETHTGNSNGKPALKRLKLDSDIFTMEMSSQDDNVSDNDNDNKFVNAAVEKTTDETKDEMAEKFQVFSPKVKGKSTKRKNVENLDCGQSKVKAKKQKENKSGKTVTLHSDTNSEEKLDENGKPSQQESIENNLPEEESSALGIQQENSDSVKNTATDKNQKILQEKSEEGTDSVEDKSNIDNGENKVTDDSHQKGQDSVSGGIEASENDMKTQNNVDSSQKKRSDDQEGVKELDELDDELDLDAIERDAMSDLDREETTAGNGRSVDQSLDNESESDFDLEEHYMYETVTDGSDKVRERGVVNVPALIAEVDEDSDPFDLMEE